MIRYLAIGHFEPSALKQQKLVVNKRLDMTRVDELIREMGGIEDGRISIAGHTVIREDGYLTLPAPIVLGKAIDFVVRLAESLSAEIADPELGNAMSPQAFRTYSELLARPENQAPRVFG